MSAAVPALALENVTVTFVLFQPAALAVELGAPKLNVGIVLSILMLLIVAGPLTFPALSLQVPVFVTDPFSSSVLTVAPATVLVAMPDCTAPVSAHAKLTVTSVLFQPFAFAAGDRLPVIIGGVRSMVQVALAVDGSPLPASSAARTWNV